MFYNLESINAMHPLFNNLELCQGIMQREDHHPERDVFIHSVQVLNHALRESNDIDLIFAAMLHDIGKRIDTLGHENYSIQFVKGFISEKTEWLIKHHIRFWYYQLGELRKRSKVYEYFNHPWLPELTLLCRWDKMGRDPNKKITYNRVTIIEELKKKQVNYENNTQIPSRP